MITFTATPEEFATGDAAIKATHLFRTRNRPPRRPRAPLPKPAHLAAQVGTITPEQFGTGEAYFNAKRRLGHRQAPSAAIKPMEARATSIVDTLLESKLTRAQLEALQADPASHHHLRLTFECGHTQTCRCPAPKVHYQVEGQCEGCRMGL